MLAGYRRVGGSNCGNIWLGESQVQPWGSNPLFRLKTLTSNDRTTGHLTCERFFRESSEAQEKAQETRIGEIACSAALVVGLTWGVPTQTRR